MEMEELHHQRRHYHQNQQLHHRRSSSSIATITAISFLIFASAGCTAILRPTPTHQQLGSTGGESGSAAAAELEIEGMERRRLGGPGSSPPTCRYKCGRCSPCKPVHVAIQPGFSLPLEYYPEAWRCKCGNKLFMP